MMRERSEAASKVLSTPLVRSVIGAGSHRERARVAISRAIEAGLVSRSDSNREALWKCHRWLARNHRNHHIYLVSLVSWLAPRRDHAILPEIGLGQSIVDVLSARNDIHAFEIKSDLDDFTRFTGQYVNYRSVADRVSVITSERFAVRFSDSGQHRSVGLMYLDESGALVVVRPATSDVSALDARSLLRVLRRDEYVRLLIDAGHDLTAEPNTRTFSLALELFRDLDIDWLHAAVARQLQSRRPQVGFRELRAIPRPILPYVLAVNPSALGFERLKSWLDEGV